MRLLLLGLGKSTSHCLGLMPGKHKVYVYSDIKPGKDAENKDFEWLKNIDEVLNLPIDLAIKSPGIPYSHPILVKLKNLQIPIKGEFDLAMPYHKGKRVLITGTNGKTTTTEMVAHIGRKLLGRFHAVGNNGNPVAEYVQKYPNDDFAIEASSYQLYDNQPFKIDSYILTSLSPDHLEWHGKLNHYYHSKLKPLLEAGNQNCGAFCSQQAFKVLGESESKPHQLQSIHAFGEYENSSLSSNIIFKAYHNRVNATLAITAFRELYPKYTIHQCIQALEDFKVPKYRYESKLLNSHQILVINDSKSTNVDSTLAALDSSTGKVLLFLGGQAKKEEFKRINNYSDIISHLFIYGASKEKIKEDISNEISISVHDSLEEILSNPIETKNFSEFDTILFSPACASFDEFRNFEARGDFFDTHLTVQ